MRRGSKLSSGTLYVIIVLALVIAFSSTILGGVSSYDPTAVITGPGANLTPVMQATDTSGKKNLQLQQLQFAVAPTPTPTPKPLIPTPIPVVVNNPPPPVVVAPPSTNACPEDTNQPMSNGCFCSEGNVTCVNGKATQVYEPAGYLNHPVDSVTKTGSAIPPNVAKTCAGRVDGVYCEYKPVIYLYPARDTYVNVSIDVAGTIVESIPAYPANGWQYILAHPDGALDYQNKTYHELFYEDSFTAMHAPESGLIIAQADLKSKLTLLTSQLGLLPSEQAEFLDFWLPKLSSLKTPYILFSVFSPSQKESMDKVTISPKPDTTIEFLAYFKGIQMPYMPIKPLILPNPKLRQGFTAVIWGGTIDSN